MLAFSHEPTTPGSEVLWDVDQAEAELDAIRPGK